MSLSKLRDDCPTTVILRKGTKLPGTNTYLQADNYGILFKDLYKHLNHLVGYLTKDTPPQSLTDNYKNPYSGETTLEIIGKSNKDALHEPVSEPLEEERILLLAQIHFPLKPYCGGAECLTAISQKQCSLIRSSRE